jgi:hypothetical protein
MCDRVELTANLGGGAITQLTLQRNQSKQSILASGIHQCVCNDMISPVKPIAAFQQPGASEPQRSLPPWPVHVTQVLTVLQMQCFIICLLGLGRCTRMIHQPLDCV